MPALRPFSAVSLGAVLLYCFSGVGRLSANNSGAPVAEGDTIRGTVLNSVTHAPISRALVCSADNRFATLTDSAGHFEFKIPSTEPEPRSDGTIVVTGPGPSAVADTSPPISLTARKPGFLSNENAPFTQASPRQKEVTLYLVPGALIVGHVSLAGSDSWERVRVEIYRRQVRDGRAHWTSAGMFNAWSNGEFRFSELSPGTYKLFTNELMDRDPLTFDPQGQSYGYPPVYFAGANNFATGSAIQLSAGITFDADLSLKRREYYPVEIGVTNAAEGAGIGVAVSAGGQEGPGYSLGYDPRTQKIRGFLPDGTYSVEASSFGQVRETGTAYISVRGGPASGSTVTLVPAASLSVNVAEEFTSTEGSESQPGSSEGSRGPRAYMQIRLESADEFEQQGGAGLREPSGPEDQSLILDNVMPGRYWVHADSGRGYAASIKSGETDLLHSPLVVPAGGATAPIEVTMRDDGAEIEGAIDNAPNVPTGAQSSFIPNFQTQAHIYLVPLPESTGQFREAWASPDGRFFLQQVPPGDYRILAFDRPQPELEYRNEEAMRKYNSLGREISLLPGQRAHLQLHMVLESE